MTTRATLLQEFQESLALLKHALHLQRRLLHWDTELSRAQVELLMLLARQKQLAIKEIADYLQTSGSAATQLVDGLVHKGLLLRQEDPNDRRTAIVQLSAQAQKQVAEMREQHRAYLKQLTEEVSDEELGVLNRALTKMAQRSQALQDLEHK